MSTFLECFSMQNMLYWAEWVQIQKHKTHAYKTPQTAGVQTIMLKHPTKQLKKVSIETHVPYQCTHK